MILYRERADGTTNAATQVTITLTVTQPGRARRIQHAVLRNASGETVTGQLGILEGSDFFPLQATQNIATNDAAVVLIPFFVFEGQALAAKITGVADKSTVTLYASGTESDTDPPDPPAAATVVEPEQKLPAGY